MEDLEQISLETGKNQVVYLDQQVSQPKEYKNRKKLFDPRKLQKLINEKYFDDTTTLKSRLFNENPQM